ncbi:MAG: efflux RND transporter permease subunit, partial [Planctomycetota bacterium]
MKESSFFQIVVNRPVSIFMITAAFLVFGVLSYNRLPLSLMPSLQYPRITLRTEYKGASPYEVETLISEPIERALGILPHLTKITSISHPGLSEVICEFSWKADMKQMILEIRENLDQVRLPEGVERPLILRYDPTLDPILRLAFYGRRPITEIRKLLEEDIKQQLESLPGVASAVVRGGVSPIVMVGLKKIEMDRYKITPQQVETRLKQENINMTGGLLREGDTLYIIRILNEFKSLQDIQNLIVAYKNKVPIRLKNIAEIREQGGEQKVISRVAGKEAVEVLIYKEGEANLVKVAQRVKEFCFGRKKREKKNFFFWKKEKSVQKKFQRGPKPLIEKYKGIQIALLSDNSQFVEQSIEDVKSSALWGAFFAFLVLLLFLQNIKNTLIVALAIPLSLVVTFAPMNLLSMSLNIMSLGGLALAAGMVVDNAIVTLESIFRKQEEGLGVRESAVYGTQEIAAAIIASTLTTVAVFFPIVFVEGIGGRLFADQALTVTFALLFSLLAALFFIPSLAALEFVTGKKRLSLIWATLKRFRSLELIKEGAQKSWKQKIWLPFWLLLSLPKNLLFLAIEILGKALLLLILGVSFLVILLFKAVFGILQILLYLPYQMTNLILHFTLKTYLKLLDWIYEWKG